MKLLGCSLLALAACAPPAYIAGGFEFEPSKYYPPSPPERTPHQRAAELLAKARLTLDEVLAVVDVLNPDLIQARREIDIRGAEAWDAGLYPNPRLVFEIEEVPTSGGGVGDAKRVAGIAQEVPLFGRLGAARRVQEKEREAAIERYRQVRRRLLVAAKIAFAEVLASARRFDLLRQIAAIAGRFHGIADEKFKYRAVPEIEVLKAGVQKAVLEADLRIARRDMGLTRKALAALMGNIDLPFEGIEGALREEYEAVSQEAIRGEVMSSHPGLLAAQREAEAAALEIELARAEGWPDVGFSLKGGKDAGRDSIIEAGLEIPLPLFNRNQAKVLAAELREMKARAAIESETQAVLLELLRAHGNYESARERVAAYRDEILPKSSKALEQAEQGFRAGEFEFLIVLDSQRTVVETELSFAAALLDLERAAAAIEELTGRRLKPLR